MTGAKPDQDSVIAELRAAVAARDEFIAIAAHELRNPMTPMVGQTQRLLKLARREGAPTSVVAGLERLEQIVLHYVNRATTLLEVSRISTGCLRVEPVPFNLSDMVRGCAATYRPLAERAGSMLDVLIQPGLNVVLDRVAMEQIADNLLSNAVKYGDGGPISLHLSGDGDAVMLSVRDRGIGMADADVHRIFGRFEGAVAQRSNGGFGIGLWVTRELVEAMGGTIAVESRLAEGSIFTVRLPRKLDDAAGEPACR